MNNTLNVLGYENIEKYNNKILVTLSSYIEIITNSDNSISRNEVNTKYFLENDTWDCNFFRSISQFIAEMNFKKFTNKSITFNFINPLLKNEIKFIVHNKIFSARWSLRSTFGTENNILNKFADFINEAYPNITSIFQLNTSKIIFQWIDYWEKHNHETIRIQNLNSKLNGTIRYAKTGAAKIIENLYKWLYNLTDERIE
uniref:hypothetical protein n=1 Tax=Clostridium butyricum TaxID=1492 RepID=UPI0018D501AC|nr:hypothetical protein [Clostridium butyricum]